MWAGKFAAISENKSFWIETKNKLKSTLKLIFPSISTYIDKLIRRDKTKNSILAEKIHQIEDVQMYSNEKIIY